MLIREDLILLPISDSTNSVFCFIFVLNSADKFKIKIQTGNFYQLFKYIIHCCQGLFNKNTRQRQFEPFGDVLHRTCIDFPIDKRGIISASVAFLVQQVYTILYQKTDELGTPADAQSEQVTA